MAATNDSCLMLSILGSVKVGTGSDVTGAQCPTAWCCHQLPLAKGKPNEKPGALYLKVERTSAFIVRLSWVGGMKAERSAGINLDISVEKYISTMWTPIAIEMYHLYGSRKSDSYAQLSASATSPQRVRKPTTKWIVDHVTLCTLRTLPSKICRPCEKVKWDAAA